MIETQARTSERISGGRAAARMAVFAFGAMLSGRCASTPPPAPAPRPAPAAAVKNVPPEALAGNWLLAVQMGGRTIEGSLHFSLVRGVLAGTWTSSEGREWELEHVAIDGESVSWESDGPAGRMRASGKIDGASMKGSMKRSGRSGSGASGSGQTAPPPNGDSGEPPSGSGDSAGGARTGGRGRGSGRGGRGRSGSAGGVTWTAYKSRVPAEAPGGATPPPMTPTPGPA